MEKETSFFTPKKHIEVDITEAVFQVTLSCQFKLNYELISPANH